MIVFSSHISTKNWTDQILEWRVDDDSPIPCSCLLVQLSRKLCHLNESVIAKDEQELGLGAMFAVEAEEDQRLVHHQRQEQEDSRLKISPLSIWVAIGRRGKGRRTRVQPAVYISWRI